MATFIGLDLAWTARNESGICWFEGETPAYLTCTRIGAGVHSGESLADEVAAVNGSVVVAIDAPVLYTPERWVERELARLFGRYKACLPIKRITLWSKDERRALTSVRRSRRAASHSTRRRYSAESETVASRLRSRRNAMQRYQEHLRTLIAREAPSVLDNPDVERALAPETAAMARGAALKRLDDTLDGLTCALAAWLCVA